MATITPKPYTVCDFCGKVIDDERVANQFSPTLNHNGTKYDLCCVCDMEVRKAINEIKEKRLAYEAEYAKRREKR